MKATEPTSPRLLLVEDDADTASLIAETLQDHFGGGCVTILPSLSAAVAVDPKDVDLVLTDMNLPDGTGLELLDHLLEKRADLPVVVVTAEGVLENATKAIRRGAYDYIVKAGEYLFAIPLIVEKNLAIWRTKQENIHLHERLTKTLEEVRVKNSQLEEAVRQLKDMAATDPLTGLHNRRSFAMALARCFAEARRYGHDLACVMIDLDNFKQINDTLGHQAGDDLLQLTGRILEGQCRRSDVAGRFGGDEFVLLLPQADEDTARQVAQRVRDEFNGTVKGVLGGWDMAQQVSMSMGLATLTRSQSDDPEQLVGHADLALYRAKQAGKSNLMVYGDDATNPADVAEHA